MARYLITQSLLSAWLYTFDCAEGCEEEAFKEFNRTLNREKREPTAAMENGIAFEGLVYARAAGRPYSVSKAWKAGVETIGDIIKGAPVQVKASREIRVDGMDLLVYGILDALKAGVIYDVKFSNKRFNGVDLAGKYLDSPQHPAYFYIVPEATEFKYLVSDGEDVYIESYRREETRDIGKIIQPFIDDMRRSGMIDIYREKWLAQ